MLCKTKEIEFSQEAAYHYLAKKQRFYRKRGRVPKIVLTGRSCSGAQFRLFFLAPAPADKAVSCKDIELFLKKDLLEIYEGFELGIEYFFFMPRLKICPKKQSYDCDCENKCDKAGLPAD